MKKIHLFLLSLLSGVLFTIGWPVNGYPAFLFVALVPMLIIEDQISQNRLKFNRYSVFFYVYTGFFVWNIATCWWIWNSTPVATLAWLFNALFMGIVFQVYHWVRKHVYGNNKGYFVLPFLWITFELVHINWKLTWPWLNLGHGFATYWHWVQWYEYTGILGGTLWIIVVNILIFRALKPGMKVNRVFYTNMGWALTFMLIPIFISYVIYGSYEEKTDPIEVVVTQPNLDPYTEQYSVPPVEVVDRNLDLAAPLLDENTDFIVAPESAIQEAIWEDNLNWSPSLKKLTEYVDENPHLGIVIGASTFRRIQEGEKVPSSARFHEKLNFYYDRYNTAFLIDTAQQFQKHHKSKLTPGVEYMPTWGPLSFLENLAIDLGGTVGSLGIDKDQIPFYANDRIAIAPLICYESVYGEFTGNFVEKGANVIFVITNDGWWGDTPGHKQHLYFSSLRAIENRRSVARSANTGISCFVDQRGDIHQATNYWEPDAIKQDINLNSEITFYVKMGDYIGRISAFLSVIFILIAIVFSIRNRKNNLI
ncbi:MAG: apolipoprotein N-acyltransferase [Bacteroidetes bacterium]|nr:apolipoprotein N-acyltransferase [Bacteroidota bacterium]